MKNTIVLVVMTLGIYGTIMLVVMTLGSLVFVLEGLMSRSNRRAMSILTGLLGMLYVGLDLYWHTAVRFWQSRELVIFYYVAWHFSGGMAAGMLLYVVRVVSARVLLTASTAFLILGNLFFIPRQPYAIRSLCLVNSLFSGLIIASLILIWFGHRQGQIQPQNSAIIH